MNANSLMLPVRGLSSLRKRGLHPCLWTTQQKTMPHDKPVRACMCYPHTFAELKALAHKHHWTTVADITHAVGCGGGCGLCCPYLAKMLETGETAFAVLPPEKNE